MNAAASYMSLFICVSIWAMPVEQEFLRGGQSIAKIAEENFCGEVDHLYKKQLWGKVPLCRGMGWQIYGWSVEGRPLLYFQKGEKSSPKTTLLECGIHGDELPSIAMCLNFIREVVEEKNKIPPESRIIIQPLLNPDGMFHARSQRPNVHGVDINRNFPTKDWLKDAMKATARRSLPAKKPPGMPCGF